MRLESLRCQLERHALDAVVVMDSDPHGSEYTADHWKMREWLSGFTGSAGIFVVTQRESALWTDSRYFLEAAKQLDGGETRLMKEGLPETPTIPEWLASLLPVGARVGFDSQITRSSLVHEWAEALSASGITMVPVPEGMWEEVWTSRPPQPLGPVRLHPEAYSGESVRSKLARIRAKLSSGSLVLSALDEVAWTLNIRGTDVHCNPVVVSYLVITPEEAVFYCNPEKVNEDVSRFLHEQGVRLRPYASFFEEVGLYAAPVRISAESTFALHACVPEAVICPSPVAQLKAIKNRTELDGLHRACCRDGVAMVRFLKWLEEKAPTEQVSELTLDEALYRFRAGQDLFCDVSFDTIAGYGEHGAIVHYEATPESASLLHPHGFLLLDSGAHYCDGTTDITRTIPLGTLTDEECRDYTLVLKGHINLAMAHFPHGTCGTQLDVLARIAMWKDGVTYLHGTGHGVGSYLNVHEGPHQIRMNYVPAPLLPGMVVTNEPGIYRAGKHGVRIENMMVVTEVEETAFGKFYRFETLTLCPIDLRPIVRDMLSTEERAWLNAYHRQVCDTLCPFLTKEEQEWLTGKTKEI